ncbi:MAG: hypothetical protein ACK4TL_07900 [Hyphomicrobiaceae bacterium]
MGSTGLCALALGVWTIVPAAAAPPIRGSIALANPDDNDASRIRVQAQVDQKPRINIGKVVLVEPASETALPIQVGPIDAIPRNSFVRIRGLPAAAVLSEGHSIAPGAWAIPLSVLPNLRVSIPVSVTGKSDVTIALVQIDGTVLAEAHASVIVATAETIAPVQLVTPRERSVASVGPTPSPLEASPPPAFRSPLPAAAPRPAREPAPLTEEQKRGLTFLQRGRAQAQQGNIAAARLFFQRAADVDLAEGALALAGTYDPVELAAMGVAGVQPDLAMARRWYEKARDLGAHEADERLRRLSSR